MILLLVALLLVDILSLALLLLDVYLWREWYQYRNTLADDYAQRCLYGALALLVLILHGKTFWKTVLSKRRPGEDEPERATSKNYKWLERPDGSWIYLEEWGNPDGQPLVFVHGWNANRSEWYYQRKRFEQDFRIILMDLPGLGKSTCPRNRDFSLSKMALDLLAVLEDTGVKNPILWGHSFGGMVILTLLAQYRGALQQPLKGVILQHTTYTNPVRTMQFSPVGTAFQKPILEPLCRGLIVLAPLIWIFRWISYRNGHAHIITRFLMFTGTQTPRQLDFITRLSTLAPPAVTARGVLAMFRYDVTAQLPFIDVPVLVIGANKDCLTKPEATRTLKELLPNASAVIVFPAGHEGLMERHHLVNEAADEFMEFLRIGKKRKQ